MLFSKKITYGHTSGFLNWIPNRFSINVLSLTSVYFPDGNNSPRPVLASGRKFWLKKPERIQIRKTDRILIPKPDGIQIRQLDGILILKPDGIQIRKPDEIQIRKPDELCWTSLALVNTFRSLTQKPQATLFFNNCV